MAFFFQDMDQTGKLVFYVATSWLLFLLVTLISQLIKRRKNHDNESTIERD
ncbi:hypothetical protein [Lentibacillus kimchii]|uniref:hypothetical protein n=1 Tax=Lentibacillus kimchii TaxID=1542911 RepID=UPI0036D2BC85